MADLVGQNLGNYRIVARLGRGGMGEVYRAVHILLNRPAAIKVLHADQAADPTFQARFLREARAAAALSHPNIVEVFDFGEQDDSSYLVMELVPDGSLRSLLRSHNRQGWSLGLGVELARQAAEGLAYAHAHGMVHRDIKPDNLLLQRLTPVEQAPGDERYLLKISDFGLARLVEDSTELTVTGMVMGTPAYMSPEQCQGIAIDGRSDLYSLGIVLYELATGSPPFRVKTLSEAVFKHISAPPIPPRDVRPDLPIALEDVILRCLAKQPGDRYATGSELVAALEDSLTETAFTTIISGTGTERQTNPSAPSASPASGSSGVGASSSTSSSAPTMQSEPSLAVNEEVHEEVHEEPAPGVVSAMATAQVDAADTQRADDLLASVNATNPAAPPAIPTPPVSSKPPARTPPAARISPTRQPSKPPSGATGGANKKVTTGQSGANSQVRQARQAGQPRQSGPVSRPPARPQVAAPVKLAEKPATVTPVTPVAQVTPPPPDKPAAGTRANQGSHIPQTAPRVDEQAAPFSWARLGDLDAIRREGLFGLRPWTLGVGGIGVVALIVVLIVALTLGAHGSPSSTASRTPTGHPHATATTAPATATPAETVVYQDSLTTNNNRWSVSGHSYYANGGYEIQGAWISYAPTHSLGNVTISVQARQLSGPSDQFYGILLRGSNSLYYFFGVSTNQQWTFSLVTNGNGKPLVAPTTNSHINAGMGASNTLTVRALGAHFVFAVNGTTVGQADDGTISSGAVGLINTVGNLAVVYSNIVVSVPA